MTDRELLEAAAKAAGIEQPTGQRGYVAQDGAFVFYLDCEGKAARTWNPLNDDGDALRLAVTLEITLDFHGCSETIRANVFANLPKKRQWWASGGPHWVRQEYVPEEMWRTGREEDVRFADWYLENEIDVVRGLDVATRRAIVRAAAEISRESKG